MLENGNVDVSEILQKIELERYKKAFTFDLKVHPYRLSPDLVIFKNFQNKSPALTVVMPIYNHAHIIQSVLDSVINSTIQKFDLILIDDGSTDSLQSVLCKYFSDYISEKICRLIVLKNPVPIYETACDNLGFYLARTEFIVEIQADIHIQESGYDQKMCKLLEDSKVGTVSGRAVHNFELVYPPKKNIFSFIKKIFSPNNSIGYIGKAVFDINHKLPEHGYLGETNCRGPWALRKSDLIKHNFLDEAHFFLGNDDHDFNRRLFQSEGKLAAYWPMRISCTREDGATRRVRAGLNKQVFDHLKKEKNNSPDFNKFLELYKPYFKSKKYKSIEN